MVHPQCYTCTSSFLFQSRTWVFSLALRLDFLVGVLVVYWLLRVPFTHPVRPKVVRAGIGLQKHLNDEKRNAHVKNLIHQEYHAQFKLINWLIWTFIVGICPTYNVLWTFEVGLNLFLEYITKNLNTQKYVPVKSFSRLKAHSHRAKTEVKPEIFFDVFYLFFDPYWLFFDLFRFRSRFGLV